MPKPNEPKQPAGPDTGPVAGMQNDVVLDPAVPLEPFVHSAGRDVAGKPSTEDLEDLLAHFRLEPADVLNWRGAPEEGLVVVTAAGEKIRWPQDLDRVIPRSRLSVHAEPASRDRVFPDGYLRRDPKKDPQD